MAAEHREPAGLSKGDVEDGSSYEEDSISGALSTVLDGFELLKSKQDADKLVMQAICDSAARTQIWAGNIGALHPSDDRRSAAFRLRSAPVVSKRIMELLDEINTDNRELLRLLQGERVDASQQTGEDDLDEEDLALLGTTEEPQSEAQAIAESVVDSVTSLFRVSILLRRATPRDRYARAKTTVQSSLFSAFALYDIRHVAEKFPKIAKNSLLQERLGNAITERRKFLRYAKDHHARIASSRPAEEKASVQQQTALELVEPRKDDSGTVSEKPSRMATDASTLQPVTGTSTLSQTVQTLETIEDDDDAYSQATSRTSFRDLSTKDGRLQVVPLQEVCDDDRPFECPYCWQIVAFRRNTAWRKHVMRDLRAYTCTFPGCVVGIFEHREDWFSHELETHRRVWNCPSCTETNKTYTSASSLEEHLQRTHTSFAGDFDIASVLDACSRPMLDIPADSACPLCDDHETVRENKHSVPTVIAVTDVKRHLADHLEQLALFAILPTADVDETPDTGKEDANNNSMSGHPEIGTDLVSLSTDPNDDRADQYIGERSNWDQSDDNHNLVNGEDLDQIEALAKAEFAEKKWKEAEKLYEQSVVKATVLVGAEDPRTLLSEYYLACTYKAQGRWAEAQQLHSNVLDVRVRVLGPRDPDTIASVATLTELYITLGKKDEAEVLGKGMVAETEGAFGKQHPETLSSMEELAICYDKIERIEDAIQLREKLLRTMTQVLGRESSTTLWCMEDLSANYRTVGRYDEAVQFSEEIVRLRKSHFGANNAYTLEAMVSLAAGYGRKGQHQEALSVSEEVLQLMTDNLGPEHPATLTAMHRLGTRLILLNRHAEALVFRERVFQIQKAKLGESHPDTLAAMSGVAMTLGKVGRRDESHKMREKILELKKSVSDRTELPKGLESHGTTGTVATPYASAGFNLPAMIEPEDTGATHPITIEYHRPIRHPEDLTEDLRPKTGIHICTWHGCTHRFVSQEALQRHERDYHRSYPHDNWDSGGSDAGSVSAHHEQDAKIHQTSPDHDPSHDDHNEKTTGVFEEENQSMSDLARSYSMQGKWGEAEDLYAELVERTTQVLGEEHPGTLANRADLSRAYAAQGKWKEAMTLQEDILERRRKTLGDHHQDTVKIMDMLAESFMAEGHTDLAWELRAELTSRLMGTLGEEHPETLLAIDATALASRSKGDVDNAIMLREEIMPTMERVLGPHHPATLASMDSLAFDYELQKRYEDSLLLRKRVFELKKERLEEDSPDTMSSLNSLAAVYRLLGRFEEALPLSKEVSMRRKNKLGQEHPDTLSSLHNLASTYRRLGRHDLGLPLSEEVLRLRADVLGPEHRDTLLSMSNLGSAYNEVGRTLEAIQLCARALRLSSTTLGPDHPDTLKHKETLERLQTQTQQELPKKRQD